MVGEIVLARLMKSDTFGVPTYSELAKWKYSTTKEQIIYGTHPHFHLQSSFQSMIFWYLS